MQQKKELQRSERRNSKISKFRLYRILQRGFFAVDEKSIKRDSGRIADAVSALHAVEMAIGDSNIVDSLCVVIEPYDINTIFALLANDVFKINIADNRREGMLAVLVWLILQIDF